MKAHIGNTWHSVGCLLLFLVATALHGASADWHQGLYVGGGGYWHSRICITVRNRGNRAAEGEPIAVPIGTGPGYIALEGRRAESVRVCNEQGEELLYAIRNSRGQLVTEGPIPAGSRLVIPVECEAGSQSQVYVYFDNPAAWPVPDFLEAHTELLNGDVELGQGDTPAAWSHDRGDSTHRASWSTESPQSGTRCLKTEVAPGAEPTWIATRQRGIHIVGGARYRMRAWVRAENVEGHAGWYIHVGNREKPMLLAPMLSAGGGSYDWKLVETEFVAPPEANLASVGTVLRGTGTAWFDNVSLECVEPGRLTATCDRPEHLELTEQGNDGAWLTHVDGKPVHWDGRAVVRAVNFSNVPIRSTLISVNVGRLRAHLHGDLEPENLLVTFKGSPLHHLLDGNRLLFQTNVPPRSVCTFYVYFSASNRVPSSVEDYPGLVASPINLVKNPSFEQGEQKPEHWLASGATAKSNQVTLRLDTDAPEGLGTRCARLDVAKSAPDAWRGWRQQVPVTPGKTYLFSTWVKCKGIDQGTVRVHAHRLTAKGKLSATHPMVSIGPDLRGTQPWTRLSGVLTMPPDTEVFELHLTMNTTGTVWHDGVLLAEVLPGTLIGLQSPNTGRQPAVVAWQVPAVEKVFPDTIPPGKTPPAAIAMARNEWEPLQLAVRSNRHTGTVGVQVEAPVGPGGATLDRFEINVCGYVPVDYPTNYYRYEGPLWHRKVPTQAPGCDGWSGWWPDPLLPKAHLDARPGRTEAVWIIFRIGKNVPPGEYHGRVLLVDARSRRQLATVPFTVRVWDFALPDRSRLAAIYDVRYGPGQQWWGKPLEEAYPEIVAFMARRRLCPHTIRPVPTFRIVDGRVTADFSQFDRAAEWYFDQLGLPMSYTPWQFYLFGWGHPPKTIAGQRPYPGDPPYDGADRAQLRPQYKEAYQSLLRTFWNHMKQRGWEKKVVLYISDEPFAQHEHIRKQMKALCDMIHEVDPAIPIYSSTWRYVEDWVGYLDIWGIGHQGRISTEKMEQLRQAGARLWFTTDGQMCLDTPYCAVERLLPYYCYKYHVEAYEFWGVSWLTYDPYRFGWHAFIYQTSEPGRSHWVRYPNGDGFLIYPGEPIGHQGLVSSVRLEQAREGVEDYEYLYLLDRLIERTEKDRNLSTQRSAARAALQEALKLVEIPNAGGRHSTKILPDPAVLYQVRRRVAEAIEVLAGSRSAEREAR